MQTTKPTILIFTSRTGGGHVNLAQSLKQMLQTNYTVIITDPLPTGVDRWYARVSRQNVGFLARLFQYTDNSFMAWLVNTILAFLLAHRIRRSIKQTQPQLLLTTHPLLGYPIARTNVRLAKRLPLIFQLTDLERIHATWFTEKHADAYLAPTREIYNQTIEQGIEWGRVYWTGRPVRRQFLEISAEKGDDILSSMGFVPNIFTIFLQGGAKGSAQVDNVITFLLRANIPVQIMLAVGNNAQMAEAYTGVQQVYPIPFTESIAQYMATADIIVGKAGASFVTEAFMLEKPFLVTAVIPNQETPTLDFIQRHNLGWVRLEAGAQQKLLLEIAQNPAMIAEKVASIHEYRQSNIEANATLTSVIRQFMP